MAQWYIQTQAGQRYGPVAREELDRWVEEGRVTAQCQVWMEGWPEWRLAPEIFPQIRDSSQQFQQPTGQQPSAGDVLGGGGQQAGSPFNPASPTPFGVPQGRPRVGQYSGGGGGGMLPDRSVTVFVFGLIGLIIWCSFLGIPAWIMGSADLKEIDAGRRDPSGRGLTLAGMILGIIASILTILIVGFYALAICAALL